MENDYIKMCYRKIDELILKQRQFFDSGDVDSSSQNLYFNEIMECQFQINKLISVIEDSRSRAMKQVCYNQLMIANSLKDGRRSKDMKDYVFLTINPPDSLPVGKLLSSCKDFVSSVVCKWSVFVLEQRGQVEDDYHGVHAHILFQRDRKPHEVEKSIYRIFSPLVPDLKKIVWWSQDKLSDVKNAYKYMLGEKEDPKKLPAIRNNISFRRVFGLDSLYYCGDCPLLVGQSPVAGCVF